MTAHDSFAPGPVRASLTIWDSDDPPPDSLRPLCTWSGYAERDGIASLLRHLETHGDRLRQKYLALIHELAEASVGGRRVVERLDIGLGLSLWWMSLLAEKSIFKSPRIVDCLRLLACEDIIAAQPPSSVRLVSGDADLAQAMAMLCAEYGARFEWQRTVRVRRRRGLRRVYHRLPHVGQALVAFLRHLVTRWPLRALRKPAWSAGAETVCLVSYFFNLDMRAAARGECYLRQWENLPSVIRQNGIQTNWVHHFLDSPDIPDPHTAKTLLRRFNARSDREGVHAFVDSALTVEVAVTVFVNWVRLARAGFGARSIRLHCRAPGSRVSLWPLLRHEWRSSVYGSTAITNLMWLALLHRTAASLPPQRLGLYLCENQAWERAFITAWRQHGHGTLIAVQHSTVRFWDMRYFGDPRTVRPAGPYAMPLPDRVALNGRAAWNAYATSGYPQHQLLAVEALRYQYLDALAHSRFERQATRTRPAPAARRQPKVLIVGDFRADATGRMLACVETALRLTNACATFTLKPHPVAGVDRARCSAAAIELTDRPLSELIADYDIVFASNTTSAALDAHLAGAAVAVFLDADTVNVSPMRDVPGVRFVSDGAELAEAVLAFRPDRAGASPSEFFWLDTALPRWRKVLAEAGITVTH